MSSYIKSIIGDIQHAAFRAKIAVQTAVAGSLIEGLEDQLHHHEVRIKRLTDANTYMTGRNRELQRALDRRNERAGKDSLILGRTRNGDITQDTATTFTEVAFPSLGLAAQVHGDELVISQLNSKQDFDVVLTPERIDPNAPLILRARR